MRAGAIHDPAHRVTATGTNGHSSLGTVKMDVYLDHAGRRARRAHLYCVGMAKSGTHSIAAMFGGSVRAQHEAEASGILQLILDMQIGRIALRQLRDILRARDRRMVLDVDSSHLNFFLIDALLEEFKVARFLLTLRDPYSWLDSFINDSLRQRAGHGWTMLRNLRFRPHLFAHPPEEQILREHGLYTLDGYLSYWALHNRKVIATIPADRLMIVRTDRISEQAREIATFAGLPRETVLDGKTHVYRNAEKFRILQQLNRAYLESKVTRHCGALMREFFPEIDCIEKAGL